MKRILFGAILLAICLSIGMCWVSWARYEEMPELSGVKYDTGESYSTEEIMGFEMPWDDWVEGSIELLIEDVDSIKERLDRLEDGR